MRQPLLLLSLLTAVPVFAGFGESFKPQPTQQREFYEIKPATKGTTMLDKSVIQNIYVGAGYETYLEFPKDQKVERVSIGSVQLATVTVDKTQNSIILYPLVLQGSTNMTVVIDGNPYTFNVVVRKSGDIQYRVTYTLPYSKESMTSIPFGPLVKPTEIDYSGLIKEVETYGKLRFPTKAHGELQYKSIGSTYSWNGELVYLSDAFCFPRSNTVVLRIVRRNASANANYLHTSQIKVRVANTVFPVAGGVQADAKLFPGQMDKVFLFVQGQNIVADNPFELQLPPQGNELTPVLNQRVPSSPLELK